MGFTILKVYKIKFPTEGHNIYLINTCLHVILQLPIYYDEIYMYIKTNVKFAE